MENKNSRKLHRVSDKLIRMLDYLNFTVITTTSCSNYAYPVTPHAITHAPYYNPWILAIKNDVKYLFEYVTDPEDITDLHTVMRSKMTSAMASWEK